ncbi:hypothetical protein EDD53_2521 [Pacificibacter maritimus]|uniref:Uncharacterized protein n=1 Tax=Pacificibacter maritimus TaxID=762213 RepID=A0A3N4USU4_9RHOB|nr:hypothetical protein EDD53_2521 [Pacificibacter maritimus]
MTFLFTGFSVNNVKTQIQLTEILCHGERADAQVCERKSGDA